MIATALLTTTQKRGKVSAVVRYLAQSARSHGKVTVTCADEIDLSAAAQYLCGHIKMPPALLSAVLPLCEASVLGIVTPIHQGSISGLVKTTLDLMACRSLTTTTTMAVAVSGSEKHRGVLDYSLTPVLQALGAQRCLPGVSLGPGDWVDGQLDFKCADRLRRRVTQAHELVLAPQIEPNSYFSS